jgi:hypothetical protein
MTQSDARECTECSGAGWIMDTDPFSSVDRECKFCEGSGVSKTVRPHDFARYDAELMNGRRAYLAGLSRSANPHHVGSETRDWWFEGYDQ